MQEILSGKSFDTEAGREGAVGVNCSENRSVTAGGKPDGKLR